MVKISYSYVKNVFEATSTSKYGKIFETEVTLKVFKQSITFEIDNIEITGAKLEQADGAYEEIGDDFILKDGAKLQLYYKETENLNVSDLYKQVELVKQNMKQQREEARKESEIMRTMIQLKNLNTLKSTIDILKIPNISTSGSQLYNQLQSKSQLKLQKLDDTEHFLELDWSINEKSKLKIAHVDKKWTDMKTPKKQISKDQHTSIENCSRLTGSPSKDPPAKKFKRALDQDYSFSLEESASVDTENNDQATPKLYENKDQHSIFLEILGALSHDGFDVIREKGYNAGLLRPDFILNITKSPHIPYYCSFMVELSLADVKTDSERKGRVIQYNEIILNERSCREFIISMVTDLNNAVLIKSTRTEIGYQHIESTPYDFWTDGVIMLDQMIKNPSSVGYTTDDEMKLDIDGSIYFTTKYIGGGISSQVFRFRKYDLEKKCFDPNSPDYVIKIFKPEFKFAFDNEVFLLDQIKERTGDELHPFKKIVESNVESKRSIVFSPAGKPIRTLTRDRLAQMIRCVETIQENGIIHRDLSPHHFMIKTESTGEEKIFLIDYGAAILKGVRPHYKNNKIRRMKWYPLIGCYDEMVHFQGCIPFAALEILKRLASGHTMYRPRRRHDLESFVRTIMYIYLKLPLPALAPNVDTCQTMAIKTLAYWQTIDDLLAKHDGTFWIEALNLARDAEIEDRRQKLKDHISKLKLNNFEDSEGSEFRTEFNINLKVFTNFFIKDSQ